LFPVVNFLKCVVTEVVLFSIVAFKTMTQGSNYSDTLVVGSIVTAMFLF